jgi:HTH-type transcriptional regulator, glycine betaine synthesis regulator
VSKNPPSPQTISAQEMFVMEWGRMSSSWGINRTMAQLHALLLITGKDLTMDEMIERLHISRGNASMNLRDLTEWGVIQRYRRPGDRKDIYRTDDDIVQMFTRVVRERKRREIDPTVAAIHDCIALIPESDTSEEAQIVRTRLTILIEIFEIIDLVFQEVFRSDETIRHSMETLTMPKKKSPEGSTG